MSIYLDYNATAPIRPQAYTKMQELLQIPANPSSVHSFGREAKRHLENSRKIIAEYISAWANEIIFTASGTEANATALHAFPERKILVSASEHSSIIRNRNFTENDIIKIDENGIVSLVDLEKKLLDNDKPALVSIMLANNETGVIQPIQEITAICKKYDALLHCDAVQALGKIPVDFSLLGADMLTISAHKCGGAVGAAALVVKNNISIKPLLTGGGQELGRRAGTENIAAIAAFAEAVAVIDLSNIQNLRMWLEDMERQMQEKGGVVFGKNSPRLPNTSCVALPSVSNEVQLIDFDLNGFAVSAGSACSSGRIEKSHVLTAMNVPAELATSAIRISTGWNTSKYDIQSFTQAWLKLAERLTHK